MMVEEKLIVPNVTYGDILIYGIFRVFLQGEPGIDAGGLYRQVLSDTSSKLESDYMDKFNTENRDDKQFLVTEMSQDELDFTLKMLVLLYNTGEGNFESPFTFGHCINIWDKMYPDKNIMEQKVSGTKILRDVVVDFAINFLEEPSEPVDALPIDHHRLLTYLWLMNEYISNKNNMEDGSMCLMVKTYNTMGMNRGGYDYFYGC